MLKKRLFIITMLVVASISAYAQMEGLGCVYDPEIDGKVPLRPQLMTRDYTVLPKAYSLKKYCPTPRSQGQHGTCTAWSTTYGARTICEAISNGWTNKDSITMEAFAPIFIYKQLSSSPNCQAGTSVAQALGLLYSKGAPKLHSFDVQCADNVPDSLYEEASNYKIDYYSTLFRFIGNSSSKISLVKKAIAEGHPVVMAMDVYRSFDKSSDVWSGVKDTLRGPHAMCVIGYDDDKYGGAFEIMNSWGTWWASKGFVWIKYDDFCSSVDYAYDVYLKKKQPSPIPQPIPKPKPDPTPDPTPKPVPKPIQKKFTMSGDLLIVERDGGGSPLVVSDSTNHVPFYYIAEDYPSGKRFRLIVSNHKPAWVYVIASDNENNVTKLFPYADNVSAYLNYSENNIALPDESHEFELDSNPGIDYFCVLYSQEELDINNYINEIRRATGSFYKKLKTVFGEKLAPAEDVRYVMNDIGFSAKTDSPIVPLVIEIPHMDINIDYK